MKFKVSKIYSIFEIAFFAISIGVFISCFGFSIHSILLFLYILLLFLPVIVNLVFMRFDPYEIINFFIAGNFIFFAIPGIFYLYFINTESKFNFLTPELFNITLIFLIVGLTMFYFGYYSRLGKIIGKSLPWISNIRFNHLKIYIVVFFGALIALISFFIYSQLAGGVSYFLTHLADRHSFAPGRHYLGMGIWVGVITSLFYYYYLCLTKRRVNFLFLILLIIGVGLITLKGGRTGFLTFFVSFSCIHYYTKKKGWLRNLILLGIFGTIFWLWYGVQRYNIGRGFITLRYFTSKTGTLFQEILGGGNMLNHFALIISDFPYKLNLFWGWPFLGFFTLPIPRTIFPNKLNTPMTELNTILRPEYAAGNTPTTITYSVFGELYSNFYIAGIIIGMFFIGVFFRSFYVWFKNNQDKTLLIYSLSLFPAFFLLRDGFSASLVVFLQNFVIIVAILCFFIPLDKEKRICLKE